jgi:cytochrome c-type biogenesis protein CcmH/NrfG
MIYIFFAGALLLSAGVVTAPVWAAQGVSLRRKLGFCATVAVIFFALGFGIYDYTGSPQIASLLAERDIRLTALKKTISRRSHDIHANPGNLAAWVELGESFMATGQYDSAANAFRQSVLLSQGQPALILAYAQAMIAETDGKVDDEAVKSLRMVLLQDPQNPMARYFMAVRQLQDGHMTEAMHAMRELYRSLPPDSPVKNMIDHQIGKK